MSFLLIEKISDLMVGSERGKPGRINSNQLNLKQVFYCAKSAKNRRSNGDKFKPQPSKIFDFLMILLFKLKNEKVEVLEKVILVADNWRFHKTEMIKQFLEKKKII